MAIGIKLKELREKKNMSQRDVAKALGISQPAYCYYESGDKVPSWATMKALAQLFNISLDELANDEN